MLTAASRHSITLPALTAAEFTGILITATIFKYAVTGRDKGVKNPDESIWEDTKALAAKNFGYAFYLGFGWCWYRILY